MFSKMQFQSDPSVCHCECVLCSNSISIYKINRILHGRWGIRILSSRVKSLSHSFASITLERYFQHSKIKFVSPRGYVRSKPPRATRSAGLADLLTLQANWFDTLTVKQWEISVFPHCAAKLLASDTINSINSKQTYLSQRQYLIDNDHGR